MNAIEAADIFAKAGCKIFKINRYFFLAQGGFSFSFPTLGIVGIEDVPVNRLKWRSYVTAILTNGRIKNTYEFILKSEVYSLEHFERKTRNRIKKSLANCSFKRPELLDLLNEGLEINRKTLKRQRRNDVLLSDRRLWSRYISTLYEDSGFYFLGAYFNGRMVGYIVLFQLEDKIIIQHAFIEKNGSEQTAPMNGLIYTMVNQMIQERGSIYISYGLDSIKDLPELNRFKMNMLFQRSPITRVYIIHPLILPFVRFVAFWYIKVLRSKTIHSSFFRELIHIYHGHRLLKRERNFTAS